MIDVKYEYAMAEVLHYLKGIRKRDRDKIPKKVMSFLELNAAKNYECDFDYNKPLNELNLFKETKAIIAYICLNYWCVTQQQKERFLKQLNKNKGSHQEQLRRKYDIDNLFKPIEKIEVNSQKEEKREIAYCTAMKEYKESFLTKFIKKIKTLLGIKRNSARQII